MCFSGTIYKVCKDIPRHFLFSTMCCLSVALAHAIRKTQKIQQGWNLVGNISFWYMLLLIYCKM